MKRRCVPLRADHTLSGVRLPPVIQVRLVGVASSSGHLSDSSSSKSAIGSSRRCPAASATRRLRFEDETETEVESRYLERQWQRRRGGQQGTGVLVSKPNLNYYVNARAGHVDKQHSGQTPVGGEGQCDSCGTVLGGGVNLNLRLHLPAPENQGRSLHRPCLNLRTEPIRETYIGSVTPGETGESGGHVRSTANQVELNGKQMTISQATPTTDLPINPYAPDQLTTPTTNCLFSPPCSVTSLLMSQSIRLNSTKAGQDLSRSREEQDSPAAKPHRHLRFAAEVKDRSPSVQEEGLDIRMKISSSSGRSSETTAESQVPDKSGSNSDGQVRQPVRAEVHGDDTSVPECLISRDEPYRLSLRRLFSKVKLRRTRTGSLDRLSSWPHPFVSDPTFPGSRKSSGLLKKTPSVQSLSVGSPFLQLRKSSSAESFVLEQKKTDRSTDNRPAADQLLQGCLSIKDVGCPSSVRSVGRVLAVCSDGTFLLEVSRPNSQMYGFIISRGRGRHESGVYVEDMVDSSTNKLYAGLLAVGDEILEVNGEKVACLSLDQVTHLLTQSTSATIRVLRNPVKPPQ